VRPCRLIWRRPAICWPLLVGPLLVGPLLPGQAPGAEPGLRVAVAGAPVVVASHAGDACETWDIPDAPARAIRVATGEVLLFATHFHNRVLRGPNLGDMHRDCRVVFAGREDDDPAAFDDRGWIASPYTVDGRRIFAVVHNEFQGNRRPWLCPSLRYIDCWYNALTEVVSNDWGASFIPLLGTAERDALVAALPYRYDEVTGAHRGYFNPSNIVASAGQFYMLVFATEALAQAPGNCLLRTTRLDEPTAWRAWDGKSFAVRFVDPYRLRDDPTLHVCAPVGLQRLRWPVTSLVRHTPSGLFIATMMNGSEGGGVYVATSRDLLDWSVPVRVMSGAAEGAWHCGDGAPLAYPSILDPDSPSPSFDTIGDTAFLFLTRFNPTDCRTGPDRDLIRLPLTIMTVP